MKLDVLQRAATMAIAIAETEKASGAAVATVEFSYAGKSVKVPADQAEDFVAFLEGFIEGWK